MRGEDIRRWPCLPVRFGSPPHARGRQYYSKLRVLSQRITPACAGKTPIKINFTPKSRDHPRMRGEDSSSCPATRPAWGSPPHARGRRQRMIDHLFDVRITPACAGKTAAGQVKNELYKDHPRMRGEDLRDKWKLPEVGGSPPHARGRPSLTGPPRGGVRITPACAGKTQPGGDRGSGL